MNLTVERKKKIRREVKKYFIPGQLYRHKPTKGTVLLLKNNADFSSNPHLLFLFTYEGKTTIQEYGGGSWFETYFNPIDRFIEKM